MNNTWLNLEGKTVIVTGGASGIGKAVAEEFLNQGANVVIADMSPEAPKMESDSEKFHYVVTNVTNRESVEHMVEETVNTFGTVDILVNNAGISRTGLLTDLTLSQWEEIMRTNTTSVFLCSRQAVPSMLRLGSGAIVNVSSVWGCVGASCETAYSASKGAVNALTMALAKELAPSGIRVNAVACGAIDTDMNACFTEEEKAALAEEIPAGRFGLPSEAADLIFSLCVRSSYLTGQVIRLDGGWI